MCVVVLGEEACFGVFGGGGPWRALLYGREQGGQAVEGGKWEQFKVIGKNVIESWGRDLGVVACVHEVGACECGDVECGKFGYVFMIFVKEGGDV